jgi:hypothetical protein
MFDNLRDDASNSFYEEDDTELFPEENAVAATKAAAPPRKPIGKLLGMTSIQRFIIAVMLMIAVCTLGAMCLLITGKIGLI